MRYRLRLTQASIWHIPYFVVGIRYREFSMPEKRGRNRTFRSVYPIGIFLFLLFLPADLSLDPHEVTNQDYMRFVQATGHPPPDYWIRVRYPEGTENEPVVLVSWYDAVAYCRWVGRRRLPTVEELMSACQAGKLEKRGDVWEWTSTEVTTELGTFKALCGPMGSCDCSHRYRPEWKNMVKGFRCAGDSLYMTSVPPSFAEILP